MKDPDYEPARVWVYGDLVIARIDEHTVEYPATARGVAQLLIMLRARDSLKRRTISTKASPTQWNIEKALEEAKAAWSKEKSLIEMLKEVPDEINLEELGL